MGAEGAKPSCPMVWVQTASHCTAAPERSQWDFHGIDSNSQAASHLATHLSRLSTAAP